MVVRVRPSVRHALRVIVAILIVAAAWKVWENVERRRLERAYGELVRLEMALPRPSSVPADEPLADPYYAAAAVAAVAQASDGSPLQADEALRRQDGVLRRQREALAGGAPLAATEQAARDVFLARNSLVTDLVERGSELRFHAFRDGEVRSLRFRGLPASARSVAMKTVHLLAIGDGSGAASSLVARLRLLRAFDGDVGGEVHKSLEALQAATDIGLLLSSGLAREGDLAALDRALSGVYRESEFLDVLFRLARARYDIASWAEPPLRPVALHVGVTEQQTIAQAMDASKLPWHQRLSAMDGLREGMLNFDRPGRSNDVKPLLQRFVPLMAAGNAALSAAQIAIAVERHRLRTGNLPETVGDLESNQSASIDPFSGEAFRYRVTANSFVVYSVGSNRRDDGGNLAQDPARIPARGAGPTFDVGVEVKR